MNSTVNSNSVYDLYLYDAKNYLVVNTSLDSLNAYLLNDSYIQNNTFTNSIGLTSSTNNSILSNSGRGKIFLSSSNLNNISYNNLTNHGVTYPYSLIDSNNNTLFRNIAKDGFSGFSLDNSKDNLLDSNKYRQHAGSYLQYHTDYLFLQKS